MPPKRAVSSSTPRMPAAAEDRLESHKRTGALAKRDFDKAMQQCDLPASLHKKLRESDNVAAAVTRELMTKDIREGFALLTRDGRDLGSARTLRQAFVDISVQPPDQATLEAMVRVGRDDVDARIGVERLLSFVLSSLS